jgi:hypothetical protein
MAIPTKESPPTAGGLVLPDRIALYSRTAAGGATHRSILPFALAAAIPGTCQTHPI